MNKDTIRFTRACSFLIAMGFVAQGSANDRKSYTGLSCVNAGGTWSDAEYTTAGGMKMDSSPPDSHLSCRVTRDITSSSDEVADWDVTVAIGNNVDADDMWVSVSLFATTRDGLVGFGDRIDAFNLGPGVYTLDGGAIAGSHDLGTLQVWAFMYPGTEIRGYSISEQ